jgi:hypothetical protein
MTPRQLAWGLTATAALTLLGFLAFLHYYEPVVEQEPVSLRGEARRNPNLAAMRFLERLGWRVATQPPLLGEAALPPPGDTLIITAGRDTLGADWQQRLEDWLRAGGRLVVTADWRQADAPEGGADASADEDEEDSSGTASPRHDAFLRRFGVQAQRLSAAASMRSLFDADVEEAADFLRVELDGRLRLRTRAGVAAEALAADGQGAAALRLQVGLGRLTVLSSAALFGNRRLDRQDHAAFLAALAWGSPRVWFVYDNDMPPLPLWLWQQAPLLLLSLALLLALWLWRAMPRLGPLRGLPPPARRSLLEHVEAGARCLWRTRQSAALLAALRHSLDDAWQRRDPGHQDAAVLAAITRVPREQILALFNAAATRDRAAFTSAVRLYQKLIARL